MFVISLGHATLFISTHEVHVDPRLHGWPKLIEHSANPGDVVGVGGDVRPARQQVHNEGSAAIAEGSFRRCDLGRSSTQVSKFNLGFPRMHCGHCFYQTTNCDVVEIVEITGFCVVAMPMRKI